MDSPNSLSDVLEPTSPRSFAAAYSEPFQPVLNGIVERVAIKHAYCSRRTIEFRGGDDLSGLPQTQEEKDASDLTGLFWTKLCEKVSLVQKSPVRSASSNSSLMLLTRSTSLIQHISSCEQARKTGPLHPIYPCPQEQTKLGLADPEAVRRFVILVSLLRITSIIEKSTREVLVDLRQCGRTKLSGTVQLHWE
jgi:hypothetical protein